VTLRAERCSTRLYNLVTKKRDHATRRDTLNTYTRNSVAMPRGTLDRRRPGMARQAL
jgi:hypothetical protein